MSIIEHPARMTDPSSPVGAQLASARTAQGLSIEDVHARTNIRPAVICALEAGDIRPSGGAVYARGHIRTLAHALGLDADSLVAGFDASYRTGASPVRIVDTNAPEVSLRPTSPQDPTRGPRWPLALAAVLVVVIAIALVQLLLPGARHSDDSVRPSGLLLPHKQSSAKPAVKALAPSLLFPVPASGVTLRIVLTTKPSWVDATDERGVELLRSVIGPMPKALDLHAAARLRVTFGDASAASVSCNGLALGTLGGAKQVVSLNLYRGSPQCPAS